MRGGCSRSRRWLPPAISPVASRGVRHESARLPFFGRVALRATIIAAVTIPVTIGFRFWVHPLLHAVRLPGLIALVAVPIWLIAAAAQLAWRRAH